MDRVRRWGMAVMIAAVVLASSAQSQPPIRIVMGPKPEPIADTKLLMAGLAEPNFNGLGRIFKDEPKDAEAWAFARGQALLIGETSNLLMLRPPKSNREAQDLWMNRASEMREAAGKLALAAAGRDYMKARAGVVDLANACNRCHQSFRITTRVVPFAGDP